METYLSHKKPKPESDRHVKESLKPYYAEQEGGNAVNKYWLLFEEADEGIVVLQNEKLCFANKKMAEITDYSFAELASKEFSDIAHPDDRELVTNWYKRCLEDDKFNLTQPFRVITCSGAIKWVLGNSIKIIWNGECAVLGFITPISPPNQTEETSADYLRLFQYLFEHSPIGAFGINLDGDILYANQIAAKLFEYQSPENMISGNPMQIGQNLENLKNIFDTLYTGATVKQCSLKIKTMTGHSKILRCDGLLHNDQFWVLIPEAEEFSKDKMGLQREIKVRKTLMNALDSCALLIDLEGRIQTLNTTAADIMGGHPQELVGRNIFSAMPFESAIFQKNQVKKAERLGKAVQFRTKFMDQHYETRIIPVPGGARKIKSTAIFVKNVTEQIQHDKHKVKAHTKLKSQFMEQKKDLKNKTRLLDEANIALSVLLKKRDEDKINLERKIMNAVKDLVLPYVAKLDRRITDDKCKTYLGVLESNLKSILAPFSQKLSSIYMRLTPSEIEVAEYIKYGKTSKEIAEILNLSVKTVETYRAKIRKKIGLRNKKTNLRTYLLSLASRY